MLSILTVAALAGGIQALPTDVPTSIPENQTITWSRCNSWSLTECGSFKVPLDYTGVTSGILTIPVARIKPANWNGKSVFYNPGGPGGPAIPTVLEGGLGHLDHVGNGYAIVAFDPRGCGATLPFKCIVPGGTYDIDRTGYYDYLHDLRQNQASECARPATRVHGQLIGTAFVARDIVNLFSAINEDGLVRYLGYSYGTLLGSTLAAMFPDKIDRMVLDGNINPRDWTRGLMAEESADIDAAANYFFDRCSASGPSACAFAIAANTSIGLRKAYDEIASCYKTGQCLEGISCRKCYYEIGLDFFWALSNPARWPIYARTLVGLWQAYNGNLTTSKRSIFNSAPESDPTPNAMWAIMCGDRDPLAGTTYDHNAWLAVHQRYTEIAPYITYERLEQCSSWSLEARDRYNGSWEDITTKTPILFVNSRYDPRTPIEAAYNASSSFIGSGVLEHRGPGHCSNMSPSKCTIERVRQYFRTGELPDLTSPCEPNHLPFEKGRVSGARQPVIAMEASDLGTGDYPQVLQEAMRLNDHLYKIMQED